MCDFWISNDAVRKFICSPLDISDDDVEYIKNIDKEEFRKKVKEIIDEVLGDK